MKSETSSQILIDVGNKHSIINITLLKNHNVDFSSVVDFEHSVTHLGKRGHKSILIASDLIINQLRKDWVYGDDLGVEHSYEKTIFFYLRFYLHYWLLNIYLIDQAIKKHSPKCIYTRELISSPVIKTSALGSNSLLNLVVKQYVEYNNLDIQIIEKKGKFFTSGFFFKNKFMLKHVLNLVLSFIGRIYQPFLKNKRVVLIADDSYNMMGLLNKLKIRDSTIFPVYLNISRGKLIFHLKNLLSGRELFFSQGVGNKELSSDLQSALDGFLFTISSHNNSIFNFLGVDLRLILSSYIEKSTTLEMSYLEHGIRQINKLLDLDPYMALSQHALGYSYALGEMCSMKNIPSLLITHGTHVPQKKDKYAQIEWGEHAKTIMNARFSHSAIQSPMASEFFSGLNDKYSIGLKTGPLIYARSKHEGSIIKLKERLIGEVCLDKKIIIHAGTPKGNSSMRPWVYETIDEYIGNINDLVDAVDGLKDVYLIVRFRPSEGLNKADFSKLIKSSRNYGVYSEGVFDDYLAVSDLLVSYSSTTIEEALQNDVAVLQYDHDDKYMHIQAPAVIEGQDLDVNPIYYCGNKDELRSSIDIILKNINLIKLEKHKWDLYRYPIDEKLEWLDKLHGK